MNIFKFLFAIKLVLFSSIIFASVIEIDFDTTLSTYESNEFDRNWLGNDFEYDSLDEQALVFSTTFTSTVRIYTDYQGVIYHETEQLFILDDVDTINGSRDYSYASYTQNDLSVLSQNCPTSDFDLPSRCYNYSQLIDRYNINTQLQLYLGMTSILMDGISSYSELIIGTIGTISVEEISYISYLYDSLGGDVIYNHDSPAFQSYEGDIEITGIRNILDDDTIPPSAVPVPPSAVPVPPAIILMLSGLLGLFGVSHKKKLVS